MSSHPPDSPTSTTSLATSSRNSSQFGEVDYADMHDDAPMNVTDMYQHGVVLYKEKKYADAVRVLTAVVQEDPENFEAYQARAQAHIELHNYAKAVSDLRRATELHPSATSDYQRSVAHFYLSLFAKLESEASRPIVETQQPGSSGLTNTAWRYYNRALSAYYLGQYETAIEDFGATLRECKTPFPSGYRCRGTAYLHLGKFELAIVDLLEASRLESCATTHYNLGLAYGNLHRFDFAVKHFTQAISLNPQDAATYNNRGISFKSLRQFEPAVADFSTAISINGESASSFDHRGQCHAELSLFQDAVDDFTSAMNIQKSTVVRLQRRAAAYKALGKIDEAVKDLSEAISLSHGSSKSNTNSSLDLGQLYILRGVYHLETDLMKAEEDFGKCIACDSASPSPYDQSTSSRIDALYKRASVRMILQNQAGSLSDIRLAGRLDGSESRAVELTVELSPTF
jgi:tetratricopeptide (TPR) repeat protein